MKHLSFYVASHEAGQVAIKNFPLPETVKHTSIVSHHSMLFVEMKLTYYSRRHEQWLLREIAANRIGDFSMEPA